MCQCQEIPDCALWGSVAVSFVSVRCVCVRVWGSIFLLLAQNLISILRKMHQHSLSVPQNWPCHAEPPNESRSDSESTHSSSFLIEEAALSLSEQPAFVGVDQIKAA